MKKKLLSLALALVLCLGLTVPALAADHDFFSVSGNHLTSAAIKEDGSLWMWGYNYYGQVGNGTREHTMSPVKVMDNVVDVITGSGHVTAALKTDGSVWQWGKIDYTAPAGGERKLSAVPVKVMDGAVSLFSDGYTLAAIKEDGSLWMWGSLPHKYRENATRTVFIPEKVMDDVAYVYPGETTAIIKTDGSLWMWGSNHDGKIGDGTTKDALTPVKIMDDAVDIVSASGVMCALKKDGSVWVWGSVDYNEPLFGTAVSGNAKNTLGQSVQTVPLKVMDGAVAIEEMGPNFGALKSDGDLWVWGKNDGSDFLFYDPYPGPTKMLSDVKEIVGGAFTHGAIKQDQSLWLWGKLPGDDSFRFTAVPEKIMDGVLAAAPNVSENNMVLKTDGSLWAWGDNECGTVGNGGAANIKEGLLAPKPYQTYPVKVMDGVATTRPAVKPASAAPGASAKFTDVPASSPFAEAISWAVEYGITSGKTETTFAPGEKCSTAQILTFLWRANGGLEPIMDNPFSDVKPSDYYYKAARWSADSGLLNDWNTFNGSAPCTRAAAVTYLWKLADRPKASQDAGFTDVPANAEYAQAVAWAVENGITSGTGNGQFSPDAVCTRGQIVTFLHRAMS